MPDEKIVSVIMPSYNHADYIEKAIRSVFEQTYTKIELIVIDDGSTDNSKEKLEELAQRHDFKLIFQQNSGVCKTLNRAIREFATGDYIALLASDDHWHARKIELQMELLLRENGEFSYTQASEFDSLSGKVLRIFPKKPLQGHVLNQVFVSQHVPAGSMLFSKTLYDRVGGFDETLKEEDWDFVIRCASETRFYPLAQPLFFYRSHPTNSMKTAGRRKIFQQKAKILAKNYMLVSPYIWLKSVLIHFLYDHIFCKLGSLNFIKRFF